MEEKKQRRHLDGRTEISSTRVGVPGLRIERTASPERLQQIIQFQKHQMEEKQVKWHQCYLILMLSRGIYSLRIFVCATAEEGIGDKARGGTIRPCSFGLGSYSSANGEATGQTDQGDEV